MGCMGKADCPKCGKDCKCDETKKAAKKPAKGVLVVIGTNAGPGPIKEGKRTKK